MTIKASLLGCGRMGHRHAQVLQDMAIQVVAIADPVAAACAEVVQVWDGSIPPACCLSLLEMLECEVPELLVIATTADGHASQALQAIDAGVRLILLEKPVAVSLDLCTQLNQACVSTGARIAVNHQMRFLPQYQIPRDFLGSDDYGGFKSMHVVAGNFGMAMNATHYFEAFRFLSGEDPVEVSAWFDSESLPNPRGLKFRDVSGCIRISTASGRRLYIDASLDQGHGVQVTYMGRNGRITIDELTGAMTSVVRISEDREAPTSRYGMNVDIKHQLIPAVELVDSTKAVLEALIAEGNYPTLSDATLAVKTLVAAYHSHRQGGKIVSLASIADDDPEQFPWA